MINIARVDYFLRSTVNTASQFFRTPVGKFVLPLIAGAGAAYGATMVLPAAVLAVPVLPYSVIEYARIMAIEGLSEKRVAFTGNNNSTSSSQLAYQIALPVTAGVAAKAAVSSALPAFLGPVGAFSVFNFIASEKMRHYAYQATYAKSDVIKGAVNNVLARMW
ncbi:MAG: hypothetical protein FJ186_03990 [Gammaproteobacteria bacterium]|nr:hypothetical protein [Gammaproteobacteria bacterium]